MFHEASIISQRGEKYRRESCDIFQYGQPKYILNPCTYHCHHERENFDENIGNLSFLDPVNFTN